VARAARNIAATLDGRSKPKLFCALRQLALCPIVPGLGAPEDPVTEKAVITLGDTKFEAPIVVGSEGERAIDLSQLRSQTGLVTLDPAFMNTASTQSAITFIDGDKGILRYRGIPIEKLAEESSFVETAYLLIYGHLPTEEQFKNWSEKLTRHSLLHEDMKHFFEGFSPTAHPMAILSAMVAALSSYYPDSLDSDNVELRDLMIARLVSKVRTIAAFAYKKSIGQPFVYPKNSLSYCANFLNMMFSVPAEEYEIDPELVKVMNLLLILHADHEQNCSTSTVRIVGSSKANLFASISAGICALWGPLHGGANQEVLEMLLAIQKDGGNVKKYVALAKDKNSGFKLMGFGHRVYKNFDPRAKIIKAAADKVLAKLGKADPLLDIAKSLEESALRDPYFVERKLYPNVDFYSGIIYRAMGFPTSMFTALFALGRLPGWIAHWKEMVEDTTTKIARPRQIYTGPTQLAYVAMEKRQ
jgi:citrate synthase